MMRNQQHQKPLPCHYGTFTWFKWTHLLHVCYIGILLIISQNSERTVYYIEWCESEMEDGDNEYIHAWGREEKKNDEYQWCMEFLLTYCRTDNWFPFVAFPCPPFHLSDIQKRIKNKNYTNQQLSWPLKERKRGLYVRSLNIFMYSL